MKRVLSLFLALMLVVGLLPISAMAATLSITQQPKSVTVAEGETAKVTVVAAGEGLSYRWYYKNPGASGYTYTSSFKGNTYSVTMNAERNGRQVLCRVYDKYGNSIQSNTVKLSMKTTVKITQQPVSVTVAEGQTAKVTVGAVGDGLSYRWYYKNPGGSGYTYTSSFKGNTYSVTMNAERNGRQVLCRVYDKYGNSVQSNTVKLSMKASQNTVKITQQPKSVTVAEGVTAKVTVKATGDGLSYRWYYKNPGASSYVYTSTYKGNTYSIPMNAERNGRQVLCRVYDKYGNSVQSNTVKLSMSDPLMITEQPAIAYADVGNTATFTVTVSGGKAPYAYVWQEASQDEEEWRDIDLNSNKLSFMVTQDELDTNMQYRCIITDANGISVYSDMVWVEKPAALEISKQPMGFCAKAGDAAEFTVEVTGGVAPYTYQWQMRDYNLDWENLTNGSWFTGVNTSCLNFIVDRDEFVNENKYRCVITDAIGNTVTTEAVYVIPPVAIVTQPQNTTVERGTAISVSVVATGEELTYCWYWKAPTSNMFVAVPYNKNANFTMTVDERLSGGQLYCIVTDRFGNTATTNTVTVMVPLAITTQPASVLATANETVEFKVVASGGAAPYTYQWYYIYDGTSTPIAMSNTSAWYSGTRTDTVTVKLANSDFTNHWRYRCVVTDSAGNTVTSNWACGYKELDFASQPKSTTAKVGETVTFTVKLTGGSGDFTYQWYQLPEFNQGAGWQELTSVTGDTYSFEATLLHQYQYRYYCAVTDNITGKQIATFVFTLN